MIKKLSEYKINEKDQLDIELAEWAFQSHYWIETYPGYYECDWCGVKHTSVLGITKDFPLCRNNYAINRFVRDVIL